MKRFHVNEDAITDRMAAILGSWAFILGQLIVLFLWILFGRIISDPYPFLFLNLTLGVISSLSAPLIMMSQNRQEERDSAMEEKDLTTDLHNEEVLNQLLLTQQEQGAILQSINGVLLEQLALSLTTRRKKNSDKGLPHGKE